MSVYKPKGKANYVYDFVSRGQRFYGSTSCSSRREAEAFEKRLREDNDRKRKEGERQRSAMTLDIACERYWIEVGQHHPRSDQTMWSLAYLIKHLGKDTRLSDITNSMVAELVAKRRSEPAVNRAAETETKHARRRKPRKAPKKVAPATVNRSVTEPLRKVMLRARDVWDVKDIPPIAWRRHLLKEPQERIRSMTKDEEARLFAALNPRYHDVVFFALRTGCRLSECVSLRWADIDWDARLAMITGKGGVVAPVDLAIDVNNRLAAMTEKHQEFVFSWKPEATEKEPEPARRPITISGLDTAFGRAMAKAGITNFRFHDLRHTAATRLLKHGGSLKAVQEYLRHTDIATTARYAHMERGHLKQLLDGMVDPISVPIPVQDKKTG